MTDKHPGRPNWDDCYNCALCQIRVPKTESKYCPSCGQMMRVRARNSLKRREAAGLIKRNLKWKQEYIIVPNVVNLY